MRPINRISIITITCSVLLLSACGGGGGGDTTAPTTTPTALTGKLIPEVRSNGLSQLTVNDPVYKAALDETINGMRDVTNQLAARFPKNIPTVFSGCGQPNAFYAGGISVHNGLKQDIPNLDVENVFGPEVGFPAVVFCHELSERALQYFKTNVFPEDTDEHRKLATLAAGVFDISILFHEVGHAVQGEHESRIDAAAMQTDHSFPIKDTCAQGVPNCKTFDEDFADWFSALASALALNETATTERAVAEALLGGLILGVASWDAILGTGGDAAHGFTSGRQANIMCYLYGGVALLRDLDNSSATDPGGFARAIDQLGIPSANCQATYAANKAATKKHLAFAFPGFEL